MIQPTKTRSEDNLSSYIILFLVGIIFTLSCFHGYSLSVVFTATHSQLFSRILTLSFFGGYALLVAFKMHLTEHERISLLMMREWRD